MEILKHRLKNIRFGPRHSSEGSKKKSGLTSVAFVAVAADGLSPRVELASLGVALAILRRVRTWTRPARYIDPDARIAVESIFASTSRND